MKKSFDSIEIFEIVEKETEPAGAASKGSFPSII